MATQSVTYEVKTLLTAGYTVSQIEDEAGVYIGFGNQEDTYTVHDYNDLRQVEALAAQYTEIRFTKRNGTWHVRGIDLTEGESVEVTKKNGSTSTVTVDKIVDEDGVFKIASIKTQARGRRSSCSHHETSNTGQCYTCGAYVAADDLGASYGFGGYSRRRY